ncbi:hypothetical protein ACFWOX_08250 [Streptomyces sp. NPDC058467]|uniref:hypothetical protein n=1 Tax=unclassified Streptomyces TaxID=2593676 RepID=UPI0033ED9C68
MTGRLRDGKGRVDAGGAEQADRRSVFVVVAPVDRQDVRCLCTVPSRIENVRIHAMV